MTICIECFDYWGGYLIMKKSLQLQSLQQDLATIAFAGHDAQAAEQNNNGYNSNDAQSYSYTYTIDAQGNYHYLGQEMESKSINAKQHILLQ